VVAAGAVQRDDGGMTLAANGYESVDGDRLAAGGEGGREWLRAGT